MRLTTRGPSVARRPLHTGRPLPFQARRAEPPCRVSALPWPQGPRFYLPSRSPAGGSRSRSEILVRVHRSIRFLNDDVGLPERGMAGIAALREALVGLVEPRPVASLDRLIDRRPSVAQHRGD